jgi:hypothetical protein
MHERADHENRRRFGLPARIRLDQAHDHWHRALDDYPFAGRFFLDTNSLIPALRSVTFVLQKNLRHHDGFDQWYAAWRERMAGDPVMRWAVQARNHIEKVGDLELHSTARVSIVSDWLEGPHIDLDVPPLLSPDVIASSIADDVPEHLRKEGVLNVERRWVAPDLPEHELLEACAYAWGFLDGLLRDAEAVYLGAEPDPSPYQVRWPDCMTAGPDARTARLHLESGEFIEHEAVAPHEPSAAELQRLEDRYGDAVRSVERPDATMAGQANYFHALARILLERDGYHHLIAFVRRDGTTVRALEMQPEDQQDKYLLMEKVARMVRSTSADELILTGEMWMALYAPSDNPRVDLRPGEREDRMEVLATSAINRAGERIEIQSPFTHDGAAIVLSDARQVATLASMSLAPVLKVWGLDPLTPGSGDQKPPRT